MASKALCRSARLRLPLPRFHRLFHAAPHATGPPEPLYPMLDARRILRIEEPLELIEEVAPGSEPFAVSHDLPRAVTSASLRVA